MVVAVEHARNIRCERQYREQLAQFKVVHGDRDILQRSAVSILCRDEQACSVSRLKTQVGRQTAVTSDIDIVGIVDSKRLVAQNRLWRGNRQLYATTLHRSLQSQIKSGLPLVVKDGSMGLQAMFVQHATQIAVIRIGVLRAVVHCHGIIKLSAHAGENRSDAVEMYFVIYERVDIYPPVDSLCRRRSQVNISLPEGITILCKQTAEEIVRATAKRKMPCGQLSEYR